MTQEGLQLKTLTGRDVVWRIALAEWDKNLFGYGPTLGSGVQIPDWSQSAYSVRTTNFCSHHSAALLVQSRCFC